MPCHPMVFLGVAVVSAAVAVFVMMRSSPQKQRQEASWESAMNDDFRFTNNFQDFGFENEYASDGEEESEEADEISLESMNIGSEEEYEVSKED
jgi:hypothetical protein